MYHNLFNHYHMGGNLDSLEVLLLQRVLQKHPVSLCICPSISLGEHPRIGLTSQNLHFKLDPYHSIGL